MKYCIVKGTEINSKSKLEYVKFDSQAILKKEKLDAPGASESPKKAKKSNKDVTNMFDIYDQADNDN